MLLKYCGCDKIIYSLHGNKNVQNEIARNNDSYSNVIASIKNTVPIISTEIHFVLMKQNIKAFKSVVNFAKQMNIKISVLRLIVQGRCKKEYEPTFNSYKRFYLKYKDENVRFGAPWNVVTEDNKPCTATINKILIQADGSVVPCEAFKFITKKPNIYKDTIENIFMNNILFTTIRHQITCNKNAIECCCGQRLLTHRN